MRLDAQRHGALRAEEAAQAAALLRVCGVHAHARGVDDKIRDAVQAQINARGRSALLAEQPDPHHLQMMLAGRGVRLGDRPLHGLGRTDAATRDAVLDLVLRGETTTAFAAMAMQLDAGAERLRATERIPRIQYDQNQWWCEWAIEQYWSYAYLAYTFCNWAQAEPAYEQYCVAFSDALAMIDVMFWEYCWYYY
jgi:hypothetical protein